VAAYLIRHRVADAMDCVPARASVIAQRSNASSSASASSSSSSLRAAHNAIRTHCVAVARILGVHGAADFLNVNGAYSGTQQGVNRAFPGMQAPSAPYV